MSLFPPDRALLFPQFETYRLRPLDPAQAAPSYALPSPATQSRAGHDVALSFNEVRSRIAWDHVATAGRRGIYVDGDWAVVVFELDDNLVPRFAQLAQLKRGKAEYPSVLALTTSTWAVTSDALLHILRLSPSLTLDSIQTYDLGSPVLLHAAHADGDIGRLLATRTTRDGEGSRYKARKTAFEMAEVVVDLAADVGKGKGREAIEVRWELRGGDLPVHASWDGGWLVLAGEPFEEITPEEAPDAADVHIDVDPAPVATTAVESVEADAPKPYRWTQDSTSLNLTITFTGERPRISITSTTLTSPLGALELWAEVDPALSTWTFSDAAGSDAGTVVLDLAKADEGTRWPSVFVDDDDVPETLTPELLAAVRDSFQVRTRDAGEPDGAVLAMPALMREEMEFDDDDDDAEAGVGREVVVGFWRRDGASSSSIEWAKQAVTALSLPLEGQSIVVKSGVDGLHFAPPATPATAAWTHTATSPALAFVLSSKRDVRAVRHLAGEAKVVALDAGSLSFGTGNAYVYYPPRDKTEASQGVVPVSGADRGGLLGVGVVSVGSRTAVVALCERELVVLDI
ncbi:hypothetical protein Q5752_003335 [Cryptotrichosporon argae]